MPYEARLFKMSHKVGREPRFEEEQLNHISVRDIKGKFELISSTASRQQPTTVPAFASPSPACRGHAAPQGQGRDRTWKTVVEEDVRRTKRTEKDRRVKNSEVNNVRLRCDSFENGRRSKEAAQTNGLDSDEKRKRRYSDTHRTPRSCGVKPLIADTQEKLINKIPVPVFKNVNNSVDEDSEKSEETGNKTNKLLGHLRSRSHGGNVVKVQGSSVEKNAKKARSESMTRVKENILVRMYKERQRSTENLLDIKISNQSSFEGKQKLVEHIVQNIRNKENAMLGTPKKTKELVRFIRRPSFSTKSPSKSRETKGKHKLPFPPSLSSRHGQEGGDPEQLTKASGDVAQVSDRSPRSPRGYSNIDDDQREDSPVRSCDGSSPKSPGKDTPSPPSRPPRRRSSTAGSLSSKKKGKAPAPPTSGKENSSACTGKMKYINDHNTHVDYNDVSANVTLSDSSRETSPLKVQNVASTLNGLEDTESSPRSQEAQERSPQVELRSKNNIPLQLDDLGCSPLQYSPSTRTTTIASPGCGHISAEDSYEEDDGIYATIGHPTKSPGGPGFPPPPVPGQKGNAVASGFVDAKLPTGPPPKKPPRTFAYEKYKSFDTPTKPKSNDGPVQTPPGKSEPIYATPVKKKSSAAKNKPSPPVRSNSDLSSSSLARKPLVAPKPPHIANKRSSLVDPLMLPNKEEDSSLQRQAHIRYSLRRPKKPPPAPPGTPSAVPKGIGASPPTPALNATTRDASSSCLQSSTLLDRPDQECSRPVVSKSEHSLLAASCVSSEGPVSLGYAPSEVSESSSTLKKRSMSDETLYMGTLSRREEPIYATPNFVRTGVTPHLHYMCSDLLQRRDSGQDDDRKGDGKGRPSIISAWKRDFRQSCRHVQNKIKKTVAR